MKYIWNHQTCVIITHESTTHCDKLHIAAESQGRWNHTAYHPPDHQRSALGLTIVPHRVQLPDGTVQLRPNAFGAQEVGAGVS